MNFYTLKKISFIKEKKIVEFFNNSIEVRCYSPSDRSLLRKILFLSFGIRNNALMLTSSLLYELLLI